VTDQVSSLKKDYSHQPVGESEGLGLENATFRWNEVPAPEADEPTKTSPDLALPTVTVSDTDASSTLEGSIDQEQAEGDRVFELQNVNIRFPERELTVVTGPTASGKTALLVRIPLMMRSGRN